MTWWQDRVEKAIAKASEPLPSTPTDLVAIDCWPNSVFIDSSRPYGRHAYVTVTMADGGYAKLMVSALVAGRISPAEKYQLVLRGPK